MEQAFIKLKLLVNDAKDVENFLKRLDKQTTKAGENISKGFLNKAQNFLKAGNMIARGFGTSMFFKMALNAMNKSVTTGNKAIESTDESVASRRSYANLLGTENMTQAMVVKNILETSGAKNPFMVAQNFMNKLGEARSGENMFLKDYADMDNATALTTLLKDLQQKKFSATDKNRILTEVFSSSYADNIGQFLGRLDVGELENDFIEIINKEANRQGLTVDELFKKMDNTSIDRMRLVTKQNLEQELKRGDIVSNEEYTNAFIKERENKNIKEINELNSYLNGQELKNLLDKSTMVKDALEQGALDVTSNMAKALTDFGGFWKDLKNDWNNNIVPNLKSGFGLIDKNDRVGAK